MAISLELSSGEVLHPRGLFDVMDAIEEEMGTDVRQYLEDFLIEEDETETVSPDEHLQDVLGSLEFKLHDVEMYISKSRIDKKGALQEIEAMKKIFNREMKREAD